MVTVREGGIERRVNAAEAFLLHPTKQGLEGAGAAGRAATAAIEQARVERGANRRNTELTLEVTIVALGSVNTAVTALRMGAKLDRYRPTARMVLESWLVQKALDRLGNRRLSREEQEKVLRATRPPHKVRWPDWWEVTK